MAISYNECLNCGEQVTQTAKKRAKQFCNSTCRSNYWQKQCRKKNKPEIASKPKKSTQSTQKDVKPPESPKNDKFDLDAVLKEIQAIRDEKIPKERDTSIGRKSWAFEQNRRIAELQKLI
jgi:hypothetical protein